MTGARAGAVLVALALLTGCGGVSGSDRIDLPSAVQTAPTGPLPTQNVDGVNDVTCQEFTAGTDAYRHLLVTNVLVALRDEAGLPQASPGQPVTTELELTDRMFDRVTTSCGRSPSSAVAGLVSGIAHEQPDVYLR